MSSHKHSDTRHRTVRYLVTSLLSCVPRCLFCRNPASGEERGQEKPLVPLVSATLGAPSGEGQLVGGITIDKLPDDALLEIFDFYKDGLTGYLEPPWKWQTLAHVCRRWRNIILESPLRLDLRVACNDRTPTRTSLDIWPPFPISITHVSPQLIDTHGEENIIAALEQRDRVSEIVLFWVPGSALKRFAAVMEEPLLDLTNLCLVSTDMKAAVLPDAFLGGFAPHLQSFTLEGIPFPGLPNLVLSGSHFHTLYLYDIPHTGYISPHTMINFLYTLPNLVFLTIGFESPQSRPLQISPSSSTRIVLSALTHFQFKGVSEYLEDFVARIDTPRLISLRITLFLDLVFDIPRLHEFIDRAEGLKPLNQAEVRLYPSVIWVVLRSPVGSPSPAAFGLNITSKVSDWQVSSMARVFGQLLPLLSQVERLDICESFGDELEWQDNTDHTLWLDLLNPFVSVKNLYVSETLQPLVNPALRELTGERVTEVLPMLQNLFLEGFQPSEPVLEAIEPFLAARQISDHPIVVQLWARERMPGL